MPPSVLTEKWTLLSYHGLPVDPPTAARIITATSTWPPAGDDERWAARLGCIAITFGHPGHGATPEKLATWETTTGILPVTHLTSAAAHARNETEHREGWIDYDGHIGRHQTTAGPWATTDIITRELRAIAGAFPEITMTVNARHATAGTLTPAGSWTVTAGTVTPSMHPAPPPHGWQPPPSPAGPWCTIDAVYTAFKHLTQKG